MYNINLTLAEFILALGEQEVLELSRPDDELANTIDEPRIEFAIQNAIDLINSRYIIATDCGKAYILSAGKSIIVFIARYLLDIVKRRPFVEQDYERAMEILRFACEDCAKRCPLSPQEISDLLGEPIKLSRGRAFRGNNNPSIKLSRIRDEYIFKRY